MLTRLGVTVTPEDRAAIALDGQARLDWEGSYLDVFFATMDLHLEMAERSRLVHFGPVDIPILSPEHLIVCKAVYDRPKDWLDIEEMVRWGTAIEADETLGWVAKHFGRWLGAAQEARRHYLNPMRRKVLWMALPRSRCFPPLHAEHV